VNRAVIVRRLAEGHLADAYAWYESQVPGLGSAFLDSFDAVLPTISLFPESRPVVFMDYRRALLRRFPFGVFYVIEPETIIVAAVFHLARDPREIRREIGP
jgi:plasmid stabilization system protein ParE